MEYILSSYFQSKPKEFAASFATSTSSLLIAVPLLTHAHTTYRFQCNIYLRQEIAEQSGNYDDSQKVRRELDDLEERAAYLDKKRNKNLSAVRFVFILPSFLHFLFVCPCSRIYLVIHLFI